MVLEGKAYWCNLFTPNTHFNYYGLNLLVNKSTYNRFKKQGYPTKELVEGFTIRITTKNKQGYEPIVVNKKEKQLKMFGEIPNGSNVKVRVDTWETNNTYGHFKGFTLIAVMFLDEVPKLFV